MDAPPVEGDKTALNAAIALAQSKLAKATEGTKVGQYRTGSKTALNDAITAAVTVRNNARATQGEVDQAAAALEAALQHFLKQLISLIDGQTQITIRDLSILAQYFGMTSADPEWHKIQHADLFDDGMIDIRSLAAIAQMVLADWLAE
jgi:hypothetical protein